MCRNKKRLAAVLEQGDTINCLAHTGANSGFSAVLEVRAVHHWGVFAKLTTPPRNYRPDIVAALMKKNFKVKWKHIHYLNLK